jgi:NTP pyrophosphatase (non-canonical NTP hydrolase)
MTEPSTKGLKDATLKHTIEHPKMKLTKRSLAFLAQLIRDSSAENNPDVKSYWRLYDEPTLTWIAEELERRSATEAKRDAASQEQGQDALRDWLADCRLVTDGHIRRMGGKVFEGNALYTPPVAPSFWLPDGTHWTMADQIAHAHSEVSEVFQAIRHGENRERIKEEIADSVYSAITMFHIYGCTDEEIEETLGSVMWKIAKRADVHSEIKTFKLKAADSHDAERDKRV